MENSCQYSQSPEKYRQLNEELDRRVRDRTDELIRANEELSRTNRELEKFAWIASHDLKEPLRNISINLSFLQKRYGKYLTEPLANECLQEAFRSARKMQDLITDILTYAAVNKPQENFEEVCIVGILNEVLDSLKISIKEKNARINIPAQVPKLKVDRAQIFQLFQNLISNSLKYTRGRNPEIQIEVQDRVNQLIFSIRDNGIGIKKEYLDKIFHIFQRLHSREEFEGTGMGLAICKKIVERHRGRIWVQSEEDKGSVFYFSLPKLALKAANR